MQRLRRRRTAHGAGAGAAATTDNTSKTDYARVWLRLSDSTLHRPFRITAWSILHGSIGCNAFMFHILRQGRNSNVQDDMRLCRSPDCTAAGHPEDITHAFLSCPDILPAIDWLLNAWAALAGLDRPPPKSAALLLADDINAWPEDIRPTGPAYRLWTRLRVNVLGAIWRVRCARGEAGGVGGVQPGAGAAAGRFPAGLAGGVNRDDGEGQPGVGVAAGQLSAGLAGEVEVDPGGWSTQHQSVSRQVITIAVEHLVEAIQRDWLRSHTDIRTLDNGAFCPAWWRGTDTKIKRQEFLKRWSEPPFFCQLHDQDEDAAVSLHLSIGVDKPIIFPP